MDIHLHHRARYMSKPCECLLTNHMTKRCREFPRGILILAFCGNSGLRTSKKKKKKVNFMIDCSVD